MAPTDVPLLADPSYQPPTSLTVVDGDGVVVHLGGEYDCSTIATLSDVLNAGAALGPTNVVVDLSDVQFLDSGTVRVLEDTAERLARQSRVLMLRNPTRAATRLLDICGDSGLIESNPRLAGTDLLTRWETHPPGCGVQGIG